MTLEDKKNPVRVFISYACENDTYRNWVAQLATQLREDGVNARLDRSTVTVKGNLQFVINKIQEQ